MRYCYVTTNSGDSATNHVVRCNETMRDDALVSFDGISLDSFCKDKGISHICFAKIEVEGAEPLVLRGARRLLSERAIKSILIEMCPANLQAMGFSIGDLYEEVVRYGYGPYRLTGDGNIGAAIGLADLERITWENVAKLPPDRGRP